MGRRGRASKPGKRHPGGKLVQVVSYDKGSEWVQGRQAKYQTHYSTALGRAYAAGLLSDDAAEALDRYQAGKRFARVYNRVIGGETYRCPLDRSPRGSVGEIEAHENETRDHDWLFSTMGALDRAGARPWLDQLITRTHTDHGPSWLDRLLAGHKDPADLMVLRAAIAALDILAPARQQQRIVSMRWDSAA